MVEQTDNQAPVSTDGTTVYVLHHVYERDDEEQVKLIGVYASQEHAQAAIVRLLSQPGFCDHPDGFGVAPYPLNKDHWTEGFFVARWDEEGNDVEE